ncbi:hypothetical protein FT663_00380 [Candidozyma haemuli var. vulneris]|uniref:Uncharacterized protein n=1 Tax=Candidozyma haemuli TaxID=45357 RepID=A0A2V1AV49_9ASCO|nr:hypothetical protein CXQ85_000655 [[Candida] haemuloni]KAF3986549.1 hypothetical protein FT662_04493 [[Candida] haemuloni var. vulneris]KAF3995489.1 hypothetical protein FT663_00380 [[Candida] haemuloni var. vulneris]PVH21669.1 hypothetical protein CXQ85_000655 [[Candida] haemuloni]
MAVMSEPFDWESLQFLDHGDAPPNVPTRRVPRPRPVVPVSPQEESVSTLTQFTHLPTTSPSSSRASTSDSLTLQALGLVEDNYLHGHSRTLSDISITSSEGRSGAMSPQLPRRGRPPVAGSRPRHRLSASISRTRSQRTAPYGEGAPGTIWLYTNADSVQNDKPVCAGTLDRGIMEEYAASDSARTTHRQTVATVKKEFAAEDAFRSQFSRGRRRRPSDEEYVDQTRLNKRRKSQGSGCEWRPESVYKTYVDCKPDFFDRSDYQELVPESSCFGKINMRIPKAWTRGPNRKKARRQPSRPAQPIGTRFIQATPEIYQPHFAPPVAPVAQEPIPVAPELVQAPQEQPQESAAYFTQAQFEALQANAHARQQQAQIQAQEQAQAQQFEQEYQFEYMYRYR